MRLKRKNGRFVGGMDGVVISFNSWEKAFAFVCANSRKCRGKEKKYG